MGSNRSLDRHSYQTIGKRIMIRFLIRLLGLVFLAATFVFVVHDGTKSIAAGAFYKTQVGDFWSNVHQNSLLLLQPAIERHVAVWLWDPVMLTFLEQPVWLVFGIIGIVLLVLGRKKKPPIGYARN
ncbi:MAG: hypothetical protein HY056_09645 [Proteobacteria bacterium]|nr:hypothetical protein [Pseudomonadota bacterium]